MNQDLKEALGEMEMILDDLRHAIAMAQQSSEKVLEAMQKIYGQSE